MSVALRTCTVSCFDLKEVKHTVEVSASSSYEAVAQALRIIRDKEWVEDVGRGQTPISVKVVTLRIIWRRSLSATWRIVHTLWKNCQGSRKRLESSRWSGFVYFNLISSKTDPYGQLPLKLAYLTEPLSAGPRDTSSSACALWYANGAQTAAITGTSRRSFVRQLKVWRCKSPRNRLRHYRDRYGSSRPSWANRHPAIG